MYWGLIGRDAQQVPCHGRGAVTQSLYLILGIMDIKAYFLCVCEELGNVLLRIPEGTGTTWKN